VAVAGWLMSQKPYYIDIGDEFLYWFLRNLMHKPMLGKARVILQGRLDSGEATELTAELAQLIEMSNKLSDLVDGGEYEKALPEITELYRRYPENLRMMQLYFGCRYYLTDNDKDRSDLIKEIEELPECDRSESVVQVVLAELLTDLGRYEEAMEIYDRLSVESSHGLVLLHIAEKFADSAEGSDEERISLQARYKAGSPKEVDDDADEQMLVTDEEADPEGKTDESQEEVEDD
jgi:tetratricopeptide (TPR) repeat protein